MTDLPPSPAARILARCDRLATFSEQDDGLTRTFLSDAQRAANVEVLQWMREAGMEAHVDAIGNCIGSYAGSEPDAPVLILGSHLDTVRNAGRYDGMLGVVTAIECIHDLHARGRRLPFSIVVAGFGDEEGVRFGATLLGSHALAGTFDVALLDRTDRNGISMRDALRESGLDPGAIRSAALRADRVLAYVELHIEQGPVLEHAGTALGVVTAINGAQRFRINIGGMAGHAGTVPMGLRRDALAAAAECMLLAERRAQTGAGLVATVGQVEAGPGAVNVIPGHARFSLDVRASTDADRLRLVDDLQHGMQAICDRRRVILGIEETHRSDAAACAPWLREQIAAAIAAIGQDTMELPSGAGHDGMALIGLTDIGMLFVRCRGGISHHPAESVTAGDVALGARALLRFIEHFQPNSSSTTAT